MSWGPIAAGLGGSLLGGLFGNESDPGELSPEQQRLYDFIYRRAKGLKAWGKSAALSGVDERQALAAQRGSVGELLRQKREQGYAALGPEGSPSTGAFLGSLAAGEIGALSNIDFNALQQALTQRRDARYGGSAQIAAMANPAAGGQRYGGSQPVDLGGVFGNLAATIAAQRASAPRPTDLRAISGVQQNNAIVPGASTGALHGQAGGFVDPTAYQYRRPGFLG